MADHIQSLMKTEKSRQVACEAGLLDTIVTSCLDVLHDTSSPLHSPLIRLFEKLASQSIKPDVLRYDLNRLNDILAGPFLAKLFRRGRISSKLPTSSLASCKWQWGPPPPPGHSLSHITRIVVGGSLLCASAVLSGRTHWISFH